MSPQHERPPHRDRPSIVVLDDWENGLRDLVDWQPIREQAEVCIHNRPLAGAELLEALSNADAVVLFRDRTPMSGTLMRQLPRLRHILYTGTRNRTLDLQAAAELGLQVSHTEWGPSKASTCEMTWALILTAARRLPDLALTRENPVWRDTDGPAFFPPVLEGKRLGLIGLGQIGQRVAAVGRAFGMEVLTWSPNMTAERALAGGASAVTLDELLRTSTVVSLHLVPSPATHHLLDRARLASMLPGSILVNTSRAELIDDVALVDALRAGRPGFGAFDVFAHEPLASDHPLLALPNTLLTPHYGFLAREVLLQFAQGVQTNLVAWLTVPAAPGADGACTKNRQKKDIH